MPSLCPLAAEVTLLYRRTVHCLCFNCIFTSRLHQQKYTMLCAAAVQESFAHAEDSDAGLPPRGFGGAGMAAGIAALVKEIDPSILVIGVEPTGANKMAISLKTGKRVSLDNVSPCSCHTLSACGCSATVCYDGCDVQEDSSPIVFSASGFQTIWRIMC